MNAATENNFELLQPANWVTPAIFSVPHAGQIIPPELLQSSRLNECELRQSEDAYVDEIFSGYLAAGAVMLRARLSRAWIDLNREPYEFDAKMFAEALPSFMNPASPRVAAGYGTIPRFAGDSLEISRTPLNLAYALSRIEMHYKPYHRKLNALLQHAVSTTGFALLVDCHSMPSNTFKPGSKQPDLILGDRFGSSCDKVISYAIEDYFRNHGLSVTRNHPYSGGFITQTYGSPRHGKHAIQIELNRAIYMNETTLKKTQNFESLQNLCAEFCLWLADILGDKNQPETLRAAE